MQVHCIEQKQMQNISKLPFIPNQFIYQLDLCMVHNTILQTGLSHSSDVNLT